MDVRILVSNQKTKREFYFLFLGKSGDGKRGRSKVRYKGSKSGGFGPKKDKGLEKKRRPGNVW